jgi:putative flippase GtrA
MISRQGINEIVRYVVTGGLCVLLNVVIAMVLTEYASMHYLVSLTVCSAIVTVVGFALNKLWTFRTRGCAVLPEFLRYALLMGANIAIALWACALLVERGGVPYFYAIAMIGVGAAPLTYIGHRAWSFGLAWFHGK